MGEYSFKLLQSDYPQAKHFIIPHHLYDNIYKFDKGRNESCVKLKMLDNRINIVFWAISDGRGTRSDIEVEKA
mgnify:FL=1